MNRHKNDCEDTRATLSQGNHNFYQTVEKMPSTKDQKLPDQLNFWDGWHRRRGATGKDSIHRKVRNTFLRKLPDTNKNPDVLDLGCGQGHDLRAMALAGCNVWGIDFSAVAIEQAHTIVPHRTRMLRKVKSSLQVWDISELLPFGDESFDGVFSHLALHYFRDNATRRIFSEIHRVLKPQGVLVFCVKSTEDPYYGDGEKLGEHIFNRCGHIRHFFDEGYVKDLLHDWQIETIETHFGKYASTKESAFISAVAYKEV
ncbi:class I SAM-dependent methyltransferase [Solwaraspora sp. WMMB762]|uniref:class I SAM-dependent methyltransferase n=1 Tax=Solwaraspora sp. WMMB762 TaxID=3404120 RepID=UPI003B949032